MQIRAAPGGRWLRSCRPNRRRGVGRWDQTGIACRCGRRSGGWVEGRGLLHGSVHQQSAGRKRRWRTAVGVGDEAEQQQEAGSRRYRQRLARWQNRRAPAPHGKRCVQPAAEHGSQGPTHAVELLPAPRHCAGELQRPSGDVIDDRNLGFLRLRWLGGRRVLRGGGNHPRERHAFFTFDLEVPTTMRREPW